MKALHVILPRARTQKEVRELIVDDGAEFRIADISSQWDGKAGTLNEVIRYAPDYTHLQVRYGDRLTKVTIIEIPFPDAHTVKELMKG